MKRITFAQNFRIVVKKNIFLSFLILIAGLVSTHFSAHASSESHEEHEEGLNISKVIFGHIGDAYDWHFFDIDGHPVSIPLPILTYSQDKGLVAFSSSKLEHGHATYEGFKLEEGKLVREDGASFFDFSITKNVASMLISVVLMLLIFISVANKYKKKGAHSAPSGFQNAVESAILFVRDDIAKPNIGPKYMRFMPLLLTFFFFIWINNMLGLIPGGANFTGNIAVTGALALVTLIVMIFSGNKHFWGHLFNPPGVPMGINLLLTLIEILSLFIKPIALMIRLFANILAGHIIILSIISMIFIFAGMNEIAGWGFSPVSLAFVLFMYTLELLVAAIQAFIFTNLTAVFIGQSVEEGHHHDEHEHGHAVAAHH